MPRQTAYGTKRGDTIGVCGDDNNGFGLTFNWNAVGDGIHNIRAFADSVEFANVNFVVTTLGVDFLEGASGEFTLPDFPNPGSSPMVSWSQPQQNFVLSSAISVPDIPNPPSNPRAFLESPTQGSSESGIGLIRGWVCEANLVEVIIDGGSPRQTAYGTKRGDTVSVCGDDNNGFGFTFNWNAIGNGVHNLRALADGVEFANVNFAVTTLGVDFLEGASGQFPLSDFPSNGNTTTVGWSEPHQNFNIVSSTVTGAKIATAAAITDPNNPYLAAMLGANGSNNLGVKVIKGPDGQPTQLTAVTWADLDQNLFANLLLGNNGLPASYEDSLGIEAQFSNFTQTTFQVSFVDAQGQVVLGPLTVPIDFGLLLPLQQLAASVQNPIQSTLVDARQLRQRHVAAATRGPFSLDAIALDALWSGSVAAGGMLCSLQSAAGGTAISNLIAAAGCGSPLIAGFAELADAGSGSDPAVQSALKFTEDVTEAPCDPSADSGAGCLTIAAEELQEREPPTEPETPTAPANVNASDGTFPDRINISWSAVTNATSYELYRSNSSSDNGSLRTTVSSTSFDDTSVSPGITYWYRVKACNNAGCSGFSSANSGFAQEEVTVPGIPTGVSASDGTFEDRVNINWNGVSGATFYEVARSDIGATTGTIIGSSSTTTFNDFTVSPDSPHEYRVRACNDAGCGEFSDPDQGFRGAMMVQETRWGR
ncbi:MAG: fibronectin type III domain-containing protein [Candidatus Competibacteraceae bacterium]